VNKVAAVKVDSFDYNYGDVEKGVNEALELLGGMEKYISPGDRVLVKPNMLEAVKKELSVTTHPEVVRAVIRAVKKAGGIPVVGDSPGPTSTRKVAEKCGIMAVCLEENVKLVSFDEAVEMHYPEGRVIKKFMLARPLKEVDKVISLAKMKTHTFMGVTGAVKNLFGCVVGMDKAQFHLRMQKRQEFSGMILDLANLVKPSLFLIDGVMGMEGNGPRNGHPLFAGVLLAGVNGFAVDVVMTEMMGFKPQHIPMVAMALEQGLTPPFTEIEVVGSAKGVRCSFVPPRTLLSLEDRVPKWLAEFGRNHLTARPWISDACIGCGRCAAHCPPKAMKIQQGKVEIAYEQCIRCYCCQELCPYNAVSIKEGCLLKVVKRLL